MQRDTRIMAADDPHGTASVSPARIVRSLARDIALNTLIPVACYFLSKRFISTSELTALIIAMIFPTLKSIYELRNRREFDPVAVTVFLGIAVSILAIFLGGDPRILLIRESLFTGASGIYCLISLVFPRPALFYFARYFIAGKDPQRRAAFEARARLPRFRRGLQTVTAVWGFMYAGEFVIRTILVYTVPAPVVLSVSPLLIGTATIVAVVWSFRFRRRLLDAAGIKA
jgi:hypothetical protein